MKLRGTANGLNLLLEAQDSAQSIANQLEGKDQLLGDKVEIEISTITSPATLEAVFAHVQNAGGQVSVVKASKTGGQPTAAARTEIIERTLRSGTRLEKAGSVIVLGDVNSGVELIAGGDIIVNGTLRGIAHAGATGREDAIVWAKRIAAPQVRIANAVARAPEGSSMVGMQAREGVNAEIARLEDGRIVIEAHEG